MNYDELLYPSISLPQSEAYLRGAECLAGEQAVDRRSQESQLRRAGQLVLLHGSTWH
jgi:hypothetical protein